MEQKHGITNINMLYPFKSRTLDFEDVILFYIFPDIKNDFILILVDIILKIIQSQNFFMI